MLGRSCCWFDRLASVSSAGEPQQSSLGHSALPSRSNTAAAARSSSCDGADDRLSTLDISRLALPTIPPPSPISPTFDHLENLIILSASLSTWSDIDALERWTAGRLTTLRFSLARPESDPEDEDVGSENVVRSTPTVAAADPYRISGRATIDRPIFIAKLPNLIMLNSTPVTPTERRDAERAYVSQVERASPGDESSWGRYDDLRLKHGLLARDAAQSETSPGPPKRSAALKSKMMSKLHLDMRCWGVARETNL